MLDCVCMPLVPNTGVDFVPLPLVRSFLGIVEATAAMMQQRPCHCSFMWGKADWDVLNVTDSKESVVACSGSSTDVADDSMHRSGRHRHGHDI